MKKVQDQIHKKGRIKTIKKVKVKSIKKGHGYEKD